MIVLMNTLKPKKHEHKHKYRHRYGDVIQKFQIKLDTPLGLSDSIVVCSQESQQVSSVGSTRIGNHLGVSVFPHRFWIPMKEEFNS